MEPTRASSSTGLQGVDDGWKPYMRASKPARSVRRGLRVATRRSPTLVTLFYSDTLHLEIGEGEPEVHVMVPHLEILEGDLRRPFLFVLRVSVGLHDGDDRYVAGAILRCNVDRVQRSSSRRTVIPTVSSRSGYKQAPDGRPHSLRVPTIVGGYARGEDICTGLAPYTHCRSRVAGARICGACRRRCVSPRAASSGSPSYTTSRSPARAPRRCSSILYRSRVEASLLAGTQIYGVKM